MVFTGLKPTVGLHFFVETLGRTRFLAFSSFYRLLHSSVHGPFFHLQTQPWV